MVLLSYVIMCLIFGTTFLAIKLGLEAGLDPYLSAGIRFFIAGAIVILICSLRKMKFPSSFTMYRHLLIIGFCLTTCTFATLYWAEQYIPASLAALLSAIGPMVITLMLSVKARKPLMPVQWIGLLLGFSGVMMITIPSISFSLGSLWLIACVVVIVGEIFYCIGTVRSNEVMQTDISPFILNGFQMLFGGTMLLILSFVTETPNFHVLVEPNALLSLFYLTFIGSLGGHSLYYWLIKKTNPSFPATWLYVSPFIALALDLGIRQEPITSAMVFGGICIISGVFVMNQRLLRRKVQEEHVSSI